MKIGKGHAARVSRVVASSGLPRHNQGGKFVPRTAGFAVRVSARGCSLYWKEGADGRTPDVLGELLKAAPVLQKEGYVIRIVQPSAVVSSDLVDMVPHLFVTRPEWE